MVNAEDSAAPHLSAQEGRYALHHELAFGVPAPAPPLATPGAIVQPSVALLPPPPPLWPSRMVTCTIRFPPNSGGRPTRAREASVQEAPVPAQDENGYDSANLLSPRDETTQLRRLNTAASAAPKRRALVSLASLPSIPLSGSLASSQSSGTNGPNAPGLSKPKSALKGTTSAFVKGAEGLPLSSSAQRNLAGQGGDVVWGFWTCQRTVLWAELHPNKLKEPIAKLSFSAYPTCIALAPNASADRVDLLIGFHTGDILWLDPICARYTRLNKLGAITSSTVTCLSWVPSSPGTLFASGHADGCVVVWDRERDDGPFDAPPPPLRHIPARQQTMGGQTGTTASSPSLEEATAEAAEDIVVTTPPPAERKGKVTPMLNPLSHWWVSRKALTDLAFAPDLQHCAVTSEDGCLRIIDAASERLLDTYGSYFGALTSVAWSADGRFCVTGGEDDLVCVFAPLEQRLVARCQGHGSFVASVAFDAVNCDDRMSRFASVGEDRRLIFWDLSNASLHRPKSAHHPYMRRVSATSSLSLTRRRTLDSTAHLPLFDTSTPVWHPPPARTEVSMLQPAMTQTVAADLLSDIAFLDEVVVALSRSGRVFVYARPSLSG